MAPKPGRIVAFGAGLLALGTAGYFANEWRACQAMEGDLLRLADGYSSNVQATALASNADVAVDIDRQNELRQTSQRLQEMQLGRIYDRCGQAAGDKAASSAGLVLRRQ